MRVLSFLTLLGSALAVPAISRIVGGNDTTIDSYPFLASMQFSFYGVAWSLACAGTLITTRSILSTAHCYYGTIPSMWRTRLGSSYAESGGDVYEIQQFIHHDDYDQLWTDDLTIVLLETTAALSSTVNVASIAGPNYILADGTSVTALGWGRLQSQGDYPDQLQYVGLRIISQSVCTQRYVDLKTEETSLDYYPDVTSGMICTAIPDTAGYGVCDGDNGGPILHNGVVIVGLISWRYGCGLAEYPGVNTRVSAYTDWIVANSV